MSSIQKARVWFQVWLKQALQKIDIRSLTVGGRTDGSYGFTISFKQELEGADVYLCEVWAILLKVCLNDAFFIFSRINLIKNIEILLRSTGNINTIDAWKCGSISFNIVKISALESPTSTQFIQGSHAGLESMEKSFVLQAGKVWKKFFKPWSRLVPIF